MRLSSRSMALYVGLLAIGLTSTIGQLVLVRELTAAFYGNELVLGLILASCGGSESSGDQAAAARVIRTWPFIDFSSAAVIGLRFSPFGM